ncbi:MULTISPECIES: hypothetical protein [unclassified Roseibium]|uniref:hypothetical protein n=1 Tax=unclassified Roseibium TaxID=2629323 RepID=UPI00273F158C|nr:MULTISPECIES: hypothetical protein [unclassified Roseibium]
MKERQARLKSAVPALPAGLDLLECGIFAEGTASKNLRLKSEQVMPGQPKFVLN